MLSLWPLGGSLCGYTKRCRGSQRFMADYHLAVSSTATSMAFSNSAKADATTSPQQRLHYQQPQQQQQLHHQQLQQQFHPQQLQQQLHHHQLQYDMLGVSSTATSMAVSNSAKADATTSPQQQLLYQQPQQQLHHEQLQQQQQQQQLHPQQLQQQPQQQLHPQQLQQHPQQQLHPQQLQQQPQQQLHHQQLQNNMVRVSSTATSMAFSNSAEADATTSPQHRLHYLRQRHHQLQQQQQQQQSNMLSGVGGHHAATAGWANFVTEQDQMFNALSLDDYLNYFLLPFLPGDSVQVPINHDGTRQASGGSLPSNMKTHQRRESSASSGMQHRDGPGFVDNPLLPSLLSCESLPAPMAAGQFSATTTAPVSSAVSDRSSNGTAASMGTTTTTAVTLSHTPMADSSTANVRRQQLQPTYVLL
ncbi:putative mediator of RNA polymerase II transcription subunit 26 isoform X1 [Sycon ciliatum]